jgi:ribosomal protein S18 acetylase RimI-like enzyme
MTLSTAVTIRPMVIDDYNAVHAFWLACEGVGLGQGDSREAVARFLLRNPEMSLIAQAGDQMAGMVLCGHDGRRGFLYHLAVLPAFRSQGIGRALVERCLSVLAAEGIEKCNIVVYRDNDEGKGFWRRLDWVEREDLAYLQHLTMSE